MGLMENMGLVQKQREIKPMTDFTIENAENTKLL